MKRVCVTVILLCSIVSQVFCQPMYKVLANSNSSVDGYETGVKWQNTSAVMMAMEFVGNTAECSVTITGMEGTTSISAVVRLYRRNMDGSLTYLTTFPTEEATTRYLFFYDECTDSRICPTNVYRLTVDAKVTRYGVTEDVYEEFDKAFFSINPSK